MKKLIIALYTIGLWSMAGCGKKEGIEFVIANCSDSNIENLSVMVNNSIKEAPTISVASGETGTYFLDAHDLPPRDGSYFLRYKKVGKKSYKTEKFGYFSNGTPLEKTILITIDRDTVTFDYKRESDY